MQQILEDYLLLLQSVDEWFQRARLSAGDAVSCRSGCSQCCRGMFDITLLDAFLLRIGFEKLDEATKRSVLSRSEALLAVMRDFWPDLTEPYLLNYRPEEEWEQLMPDDDETPCILLGEDGRCMVYEHRPMTCRLHGLPLVDISGEIMHDEWCTLNFVGKDAVKAVDIRWEFRELFGRELVLFRRFAHRLTGTPVNELDTFIPLALLIDFRGYDWSTAVAETCG